MLEPKLGNTVCVIFQDSIVNAFWHSGCECVCVCMLGEGWVGGGMTLPDDFEGL